MVSEWMSGTSPDSTSTWLNPCSASRATINACPVPRCSACSTNWIPVDCSASRTSSASCPIMAKIFSAGTILLAAATTWPNSVLPAIWCSTLGCRDFNRVPFPAAIIAIANLSSVCFEGLAESDLWFIMTLQGIKRRLGIAFRGDGWGLARFQHQPQQVMGDVVRVVPRDQSFPRIDRLREIVAQYWLHAQGLDAVHIHHDLRLLQIGVFRPQH